MCSLDNDLFKQSLPNVFFQKTQFNFGTSSSSCQPTQLNSCSNKSNNKFVIDTIHQTLTHLKHVQNSGILIQLNILRTEIASSFT